MGRRLAYMLAILMLVACSDGAEPIPLPTQPQEQP